MSQDARPLYSPPVAPQWRMLTRSLAPTIEWLLVSRPVPPGRALDLWQHGLAWTGDAPHCFWAAANSGHSFCGLGTAVELTARGSDRFAEIERGSSELWRTICVPESSEPRVEPRLLGGFAFRPRQPRETPWADFPDAWFVLPRWLYQESGGRASLTLAVRRTELERSEAELARLDQLAQRLGQGATRPSSGPPSPAIVRWHERDPSAWLQAVAQLRQRLSGGEFSKVVAARRAVVELADAPDSGWLLRRLASQSPQSCCFGLSRGGSTFLGATPEWLIRRQGNRAESEALAGSAPVGDGADALLASAKERREHDWVVREIERELSSLSRQVRRLATPSVMRLQHVLHLCTPLAAELREPVPHVLTLVDRLHPTPAVGGVPNEAALRWIDENEACERGWYSAPVGWFDERGDGQFAVALRSGVIRGRHAYAYAGAGIMADSQPTRELEETELKLQAFLGALGVT